MLEPSSQGSAVVVFEQYSENKIMDDAMINFAMACNLAYYNDQMSNVQEHFFFILGAIRSYFQVLCEAIFENEIDRNIVIGILVKNRFQITFTLTPDKVLRIEWKDLIKKSSFLIIVKITENRLVELLKISYDQGKNHFYINRQDVESFLQVLTMNSSFGYLINPSFLKPIEIFRKLYEQGKIQLYDIEKITQSNVSSRAQNEVLMEEKQYTTLLYKQLNNILNYYNTDIINDMLIIQTFDDFCNELVFTLFNDLMLNIIDSEKSFNDMIATRRFEDIGISVRLYWRPMFIRLYVYIYFGNEKVKYVITYNSDKTFEGKVTVNDVPLEVNFNELLNNFQRVKIPERKE